MKMSRTGARSSGWAAFDLKQRQKHGLEPEIDEDPFPPFPSTLIPLCSCESITTDNDLSTRPFASVLLPSGQKFVETAADSPRKQGEKIAEGNGHNLALKRLKVLHSWADDNLIEDIMAAVGNDFEKASTLLKRMMSSSGDENNKEATFAEISSMIDDKKTEESSLSRITLGLNDFNSSSEVAVKESLRESSNVLVSCGTKLSDNATDTKSIVELLSSVPVEPEWEEDDVYLIHRKDALKMMRSASQHSKAANNAFLRDDHFSAQQHSRKAQEEWLIAEKLNSKAAKEILSIRNTENDMWKLDLHGLHAVEAVQALQERLQQIEMQVPMNQSLSPNRVRAKNVIVRSSSNQSFSCMNMEDVDKQQASRQQTQKPLEVITGVGNHSKGQAALPTAVRSFLSENRYRFEEMRPGIIIIRPKFRHR